ncbi:MAG: diaminopimelate epimerase [Buchnera aphidicola (Eriosoma harunire)]
MFFSKMQALGNDFMVVNNIIQTITFSKNIIKSLSHRYRGIGFDQLLVLEKNNNINSDFYCRIFNADGNEVYQCGNGIRCLAYFIYYKNIIRKKNIVISTRNNIMACKIFNKDQIVVNMGQPKFSPIEIPFLSTEMKKCYSIDICHKKISFGVVSLGNPHCVVVLSQSNELEINIIGPLIEKHHLFPEQVNVGFMTILTPKHIKLRVYERGVGETQACGSGASAAVAVGINQQLLDNCVQVDLLGGSLDIRWLGRGCDLYMSGPARYIYDGFIFV